jgi:hypothetical protein
LLSAVVVFSAYVVTANSGRLPKGRDYYFRILGEVDEGPPLFVVTEKELWDSRRSFSPRPVPSRVLPRGFFPEWIDLCSALYRYDGSGDQGQQELLKSGLIENPGLDLPSCNDREAVARTWLII